MKSNSSQQGTIVSHNSMSPALALPNQASVNDSQAPSPTNPAQNKKRVRLTQMQAGNWLRYLEQMATPKSPMGDRVEQLHDALSDACWLARWKRDDVVLEFCPSTLPDIYAGLLQLSQRDQNGKEFDVLEEMLLAQRSLEEEQVKGLRKSSEPCDIPQAQKQKN